MLSSQMGRGGGEGQMPSIGPAGLAEHRVLPPPPPPGYPIPWSGGEPSLSHSLLLIRIFYNFVRKL